MEENIACVALYEVIVEEMASGKSVKGRHLYIADLLGI
jgi:hypothetical protein